MWTARKQPQEPSPTSSLHFANERKLPKPTAARAARILVNLCRLRKGMPSPSAFVFAIAYVLNQYSDDVINYVVDPVDGLPGSLKYPLEIADVQKTCELRVRALATETWSRRAPFEAPSPSQTERAPSLGIEFSNGIGQSFLWIVRCEGSASKAGVMVNDRVTKETRRRIAERMKTAKPGDHIELPVLRGGQDLVIDIVLGAAK
jgi:hypothetical protein